MKRIMLTVCLMFVLATTTSVFAHDYDRDDAGHPLQIFSYVLRPIGIGLEYAIFRPLHKLVSKPDCAIVFGHEPGEDDIYDEWK